jgi:hypothetical protein
LWPLALGDLTGATGSIQLRFRERSRHPRVVNSNRYDQVAVSTATVAGSGVAQVPDDEWFGEGSAFDSGEDLAAALFALAGVAHTEVAPEVAEVSWPVIAIPEADNVFEEVQRPGSSAEAARPYSTRGSSTSTSASPRSWSVRSPGEALLPPTMSGRSGWTIRNSVAVLHRTEDAIARLREDAVAMAFLAAAEACGRGRPASLERRKHPR